MQRNKKIDCLRFFFVILVVMFHMNGRALICNESSIQDFYIFNVLNYIFTTVPPIVSIPGLFAISGYLFFANVTEWNFSVYKSKIQHRVYSLLIPFVIWNLMKFITSAIISYHNGGMNGIVQMVNDNGGWLIFWNGAFPCHNPLMMVTWYLRDLIVMSLLTPILYFLIRKSHYALWLVLVVCGLTDFWPTDNVCTAYNLSFFVLGITLSQFEIKFKLGKWSNLLILFMAVLALYFCNVFDSTLLGYVTTLLMLISLYNYFGLYINIKEEITSASTFVYLGHGFFVLSAFSIIINKCIPIDNELCMCLRYILTPVITIMFLVVSDHLLQKKCPGLHRILVGR